MMQSRKKSANKAKLISKDAAETIHKTARQTAASAAKTIKEEEANAEELMQDYNQRMSEALQEYGHFMLDCGQRSLQEGFEALNGMAKMRTWQDIARFQQDFYWQQITKMIQDSNRAVEIGLASGERLAKAVHPHLQRMVDTMHRGTK